VNPGKSSTVTFTDEARVIVIAEAWPRATYPLDLVDKVRKAAAAGGRQLPPLCNDLSTMMRNAFGWVE
jgi:hypothetical protein